LITSEIITQTLTCVTINHKPDSSGNPEMQRSGMRSWNG